MSVEYPAALAALPILLYGLWGARSGRERRTTALRLLAGAALPLLLLALYHQALFGRPWATGYAFLDPGCGPTPPGRGEASSGAGLPRPEVALALLAGLRRGLLTHAPWLVLALPGAVLLWRRRRAEALTALGVLGALLALNSGYAFWDGGASWGPRHLVPALPFLALLALPAAARWTPAAHCPGGPLRPADPGRGGDADAPRPRAGLPHPGRAAAPGAAGGGNEQLGAAGGAGQPGGALSPCSR